jgi:hypothetical protein
MATYDFSGANGDPIPVGLTVEQGGFEIQNNSLEATTGDSLFYQESNADSYTELDLNLGGSTSVSGTNIIARMSDSSNYILLHIKHQDGRCRLFKNESGSLTQFGTEYTIPSFDQSAYYKYKIDVSGSTIKGYVDDVEKLSGTSSFNSTETKFGALLFFANTESIDGLTIPDDGILPIADAGTEQAVTKDSVVTLDGSGSIDSNSTGVLTYTWSQVSGENVTLSDNTAVNPTFTPTKFGNYVFSLTVNDGTKESLADSVKVGVPRMGGLTRYKGDKLGELITTPPSMVNEEGVYFPSLMATSEIPDSNFPSKFDFVCYSSPSHSTGDAGIWLFLCEGDPTIPANWIEYDDAVANGDFDYLVSKPSGNPIFVDTAFGEQTETPCVNNIDGTLFMTYHNAGNAIYAGNSQHTCLAKSTDGINYTREYIAGNINGTLLSADPQYVRGNGHTGYFKWGVNPFTEVGYSYVGYSIYGGGDWYCQAMWVSDNAEDWHVHAYLSNIEGRVTENIPVAYLASIESTFDPRNIEPMGDGTYRVMTTVRETDAGTAGIKNTRLVEVLIGSDGHTILTEANTVMAPTEGTFDEGDVRASHVFLYNGEKYLIYTGSKLVLSDVENSLGIAKLNEYEGALTVLPLLKADTNNTDFRGAASLPNNFVFYNPNGDASYVLSEVGLEILVPAGSKAGFYLTDTVDLSVIDICDVYLKGFRWISDKKCRTFTGFYNSITDDSAHPNLGAVQIGVSNSYFRLYSNDSIDTYRTATTGNYVGYDNDYTARLSESPQAPLDVGVRIIPGKGGYFLTGGKSERNMIDGNFTSGTVRPMFWFTNTDTEDNTVIIEGLEFGDTLFTYETSIEISSILNMTATNTPDGTYSADIYNNGTKTLIETRNITFSGGDASETIPLDAGAEVLVFIEGANPPTTGLPYIGVTE